MAIAKKNSKRAASPVAPPAVGVQPAGAKKDKAPRRSDDDGEGSGRSTPLGLEVDHEVLDFIAALERFKKSNHRPFPSWSEVLFVLKDLGYRKA